MKSNIWRDIQICISVSLSIFHNQENHSTWSSWTGLKQYANKYFQHQVIRVTKFIINGVLMKRRNIKNQCVTEKNLPYQTPFTSTYVRTVIPIFLWYSGSLTQHFLYLTVQCSLFYDNQYIFLNKFPWVNSKQLLLPQIICCKQRKNHGQKSLNLTSIF